MLFLLINPSHPLPPERKNAIAPGIRLFHQKPFFYLFDFDAYFDLIVRFPEVLCAFRPISFFLFPSSAEFTS